MIQANELRIGNWVTFNDYTDCIERTDFVASYFDSYEGIPLTPEILEACNLKMITHDEFILGRYSIRKEKNIKDPCYEIYILGNDQTFHFIMNFQYLHQLQNLYFALTGNELEYKTVPA